MLHVNRLVGQTADYSNETHIKRGGSSPFFHIRYENRFLSGIYTFPPLSTNMQTVNLLINSLMADKCLWETHARYQLLLAETQ